MDDRLTLRQACDLLGVEPSVDPHALRKAWARALKAARPERHGGDERPLRIVIAAHRLLKGGDRDAFVLPPAPWRPAPPVPVRCELIVSSAQAEAGVWRVLRMAGRAWRLRVPPAARDGQTLRLRRAAENGADLLVRLRVARAEPEVTETLRRRFSAAWAA